MLADEVQAEYGAIEAACPWGITLPQLGAKGPQLLHARIEGEYRVTTGVHQHLGRRQRRHILVQLALGLRQRGEWQDFLRLGPNPVSFACRSGMGRAGEMNH